MEERGREERWRASGMRGEISSRAGVSWLGVILEDQWVNPKSIYC